MDRKSIRLNGIDVYEGQVFGRQGDIYVRWLGYASEPAKNTTVVSKRAITGAVGESGHQHVMYAATDTGEVDKDGRLDWLRAATQESPDYLTNFAHANGLGVDEELIVQTSPTGAVLVHEAGPIGARDDDEHGPIPLPANSRIGMYRQVSTELSKRRVVAD